MPVLLEVLSIVSLDIRRRSSLLPVLVSCRLISAHSNVTGIPSNVVRTELLTGFPEFPVLLVQGAYFPVVLPVVAGALPPVLPAALAALLPVVGAEGGRTITERPVQ